MSAARHLFETRLWLPAPIEPVFELFSAVESLNPLTPPWFHLTPLRKVPAELTSGLSIPYTLRLHGLPVRWTSRITHWDPPRRFVYEQERGPYRYFEHDHLFAEVDGGTETLDRVRFAVLGGRPAAAFVRWDLNRIFAHRRRVARDLLAAGRDVGMPSRRAREAD